jgi:DNA-binding XRE family transcriptional regulator
MYQIWYRPSGVRPPDSGLVPDARKQERALRLRRQALAERVLALRTELGWTQEELAHQAGFDRKSVSRIENGAYSPSGDRLFVLADALGLTLAALVDGIK